MGGFSVVMLSLIMLMIMVGIIIFANFILPLISSWIIMPGHLENRGKKIFSMWLRMIGIQTITAIIISLLMLLIEFILPFGIWSSSDIGIFERLIFLAVQVVTVVILTYLYLMHYKRVSKNPATKKTHIVLIIQSLLMASEVGTFGYILVDVLS